MKYKPYSVVTPAFNVTSGGIRVMHGLHGWLLAKGQISYLNATYDDKDFVAIYPEIYHGNQTEAKTVIRYILATPGTMSSNGIPGPITFNHKDKIFVFSKIYDTFGVDDDHLLFLPICNLHLFKVTNKGKRKKTCFLVGKGINTWKHPKNSIELTRTFSVDQQALADLLNECHTLYCYDRLSAIMEIVRLCGCRVVYLGNFSKTDLQKYEPGMNGITYGNEYYIPLNIEDFREHYIGMVKTFERKLDKFIEITQG